MKQQFLDLKFRGESESLIRKANEIITAYAAQGYRLTLRQLYYQFVARDLIPNTEKSYKRIGELISNGRLAGLIDWDAIEDRTRNLKTAPHWSTPADIIQAAAQSFRIDKWQHQPNRVEVWVEKDALVGVLQPVCTRHDVSYFACRGYVSQSEMYDTGRRIARYIKAGQDVTIIHLGDHDPSGIDMTRDLRDRLAMFLQGLGADVNRIALNWDQIEAYKPPPNPAKTTDARFASYADRFGDESWELDALEPRVLDALIDQHIEALKDPEIWAQAVAEETEGRELLALAADHWEELADYLQEDGPA